MHSQRHRFLKKSRGSSPEPPSNEPPLHPLSYSLPAHGLRRSVQVFDLKCPPVINPSGSSPVGLLRTSSVRISFCQDTTCIFNSLAGGRVAIVTMHSLRRLIHCFYSETDYRKFEALLLEYFSARVHRTLI